jgi:hypothetical protein
MQEIQGLAILNGEAGLDNQPRKNWFTFFRGAAM